MLALALVVFPTIGVLAVFVGPVLYAQWSSMREIRKTQSVLLFKTDHVALLTACRDVWAHRTAFGKDEMGFVDVDPSNPKLPAAILALNAHWIGASASGVEIELGGNGCHYGFETFFDSKPDEKRTVWKDVYPSKELAPDLWYYAENGLPQSK